MAEAFTYCWTNKERNKLYVGAHKGSTEDGYVCSNELMLEEYKRKPEIFSREILAFGTYQDMIRFETAILKGANAAKDPSFYNMHNGDGEFYNKGHSDITKQKLKIARNQRKDKPREGKPLSAEGKKKASESAKKAALTDKRGQRLAENRGKGVDYSMLMKEVWRKRKEGLIDMPSHTRKRGT